MTFLVTACIVLIAGIALYFINDSKKAHEGWKFWLDSCFDSQLENTRLQEELRVWKRPRDPKTGRWV